MIIYCYVNRVDGRLAVRLTDGALSSDLFPHDYHHLGDCSDRRPIKWLALEALVERKFSIASDVVSRLSKSMI